MRLLVVLALLLLTAAPALSVAPGSNGGVVFAAGDPLGRGSVLELVDARGAGGARALTRRALDATMPAVSPDGRVAFASLRRKGGGIFVLALAGGAPLQVTRTPGDVDPAWSPDGTQLVFARRRPAGGHRLLLVPASGGTPTPVPGALGRRPDFSPDGKRIVYERDGASTGIGVTTLAGGGFFSLGPGSAPSWSPTGTQIAYSARFKGRAHLFLVQPDGTGVRDISFVVPAADPAWSPDGLRIVFVGNTAAGTCCGLVTVDTSGGHKIQITHGLWLASAPSWGPAPTP